MIIFDDITDLAVDTDIAVWLVKFTIKIKYLIKMPKAESTGSLMTQENAFGLPKADYRLSALFVFNIDKEWLKRNIQRYKKKKKKKIGSGKAVRDS